MDLVSSVSFGREADIAEARWPAAAARVLVGVDPCRDQRALVRSGIAIGRRLRAEIGLVHCVNGYEEASSTATMNLDELAAGVAPDLSSPWSVAIPGSPGRMLPAYANGIGADLIVIGARRQRRFAMRREDTVASALLQRANCSVAIIPPLEEADEAVARCEHIVCALAFNARTQAVAQNAARLARALRARLTFLHVKPEVSEALLAWELQDGGEIVLDTEAAMARLQAIALRCGGGHECCVATGDVVSRVRKSLRSLRAGMLIAGRPVRQMRSEFNRLIEHIDYPVFVVPDEDPVKAH